MKVRDLTLGLVIAGVVLAGTPAFAQSPREGGSPGGSSERGGGGGTAGGNTAGGGGGGGGVAIGGGGSSSSSSGGGAMGGGGFSSPGMSATSPNVSFGDRSVRQTAPSRRTEYAAFTNSASNGDAQARPRTGAPDNSGGGGGDRAVPRGGASGGGDASSGGAVNTRERARPTADNSNGNNSAGAREIPTWSRPRGDRPSTGVAVDRVGPPPDPDRDNRGRYYPYYGYGGYGGYYNTGYGYYGCGYGWGCYPYSFGLGYGLYSGIGWNPYVGDPFDPYYSGGYGGYSSGVYNTRESGNLKLKVKPRTAKVYVDGFYIGLVDEFDGAFQKLALNSGRHKVEIRADGYETAEFDVVITPDQTVTFQGDLKRIQ